MLIHDAPVRQMLQSATARGIPWMLFAIAAFIFLAPNVDFAVERTWHDGQRFAQLTLLAVAGLTLALPGAVQGIAGSWLLMPAWIRAALLVALALGLASALTAPLPRWALLEWAMLWLLLLLMLDVAAQVRRHGHRLDPWLVLLAYATALAYTISVAGVYAGMLLVGAGYGLGFDVRELYVGFSNVRFFGHIQTMLLPFLLLPALWWGCSPLRRVLLGIVPAIWWMLAVASGTRGTWVALLVGVVAVAICGGRNGRQWIRWQFAGFLGGLLCHAVFIKLLPWWLEQPVSFIHRGGDMISLSGREMLWARALEFVAEHPWLGIGAMHYAYFVEAVGAHPHNAVLQWLAEWGIPAALLLTGVCAAAGMAFARRVRDTADAAGDRRGMLQVALLAALAGAAAQSMVDGVLVMPVSQVLLALLCGWAMGMHFSGMQAYDGRVARALVIGLTLVAAVFMVRGVLPEVGRLAEREKAFLARHVDGYNLLPRFWAHGSIRE